MGDELNQELSGTRLNDLVDLIGTKTGHDAFAAFLKLEYSIENLYFWKEINLYHGYCADLLVAGTRSEAQAVKAQRQMMRRAANIYHFYVAPSDAVYEINIRFSILDAIQRTLRYTC